MRFAVELQAQFSVHNIAPSAVERCSVFAATRFHQYKVRIGSTTDTVCAGDHIHGIIGSQLANMVDEQDCDTVFVCQCFQCTNITVVVGVRISIVTTAADAL